MTEVPRRNPYSTVLLLSVSLLPLGCGRPPLDAATEQSASSLNGGPQKTPPARLATPKEAEAFNNGRVKPDLQRIRNSLESRLPQIKNAEGEARFLLIKESLYEASQLDEGERRDQLERIRPFLAK